MHISTIQNTDFKGIPIASIKINGQSSYYKLYELTNKDKNFLYGMYNSVDLKKLMPNLQEHEYIIWDGVLKNTIDTSISTGKKALLETFNNKPCGIMNYKESNKKHYLSYITTFPVKAAKKVPYAGQVLFNEFFKRFLKSSSNIIELSAIRNSPFSPISKYLALGFKMCGGNDYNEIMRINREKVFESLAKQDKFIHSKKIETAENIDLNKVIKLNQLSF